MDKYKSIFELYLLTCKSIKPEREKIDHDENSLIPLANRLITYCNFKKSAFFPILNVEFEYTFNKESKYLSFSFIYDMVFKIEGVKVETLIISFL